VNLLVRVWCLPLAPGVVPGGIFFRPCSPGETGTSEKLLKSFGKGVAIGADTGYITTMANTNTQTRTGDATMTRAEVKRIREWYEGGEKAARDGDDRLAQWVDHRLTMFARDHGLTRMELRAVVYGETG